MLEYDEPLYSEDEIANACMKAGVSNTYCELVLLALQRGRMTDEEKGAIDAKST